MRYLAAHGSLIFLRSVQSSVRTAKRAASVRPTAAAIEQPGSQRDDGGQQKEDSAMPSRRAVKVRQPEKLMAGGQDEMSKRAQFRATNINPKVLAKIKELSLTTDTSAAGRLSARLKRKGDARPFHQRYPLYGEPPPEVLSVMGGDRFPTAKFIAAAVKPESLPAVGPPEIAFAGRSNVGKSSLINAVTMAAVARQSDKPGKTQSLNFFSLKEAIRLIDLPGYGAPGVICLPGFAFANELKQARWTELMDSFLVGRGSTLKRVMVVVDARHGIKVSDRQMIQFLSKYNVRFQIVLNKTDCLAPDDLARRWAVVSEEIAQLRGSIPTIHMVSTMTGAGIGELAREIARLAQKPGSASAAGGPASGQKQPLPAAAGGQQQPPQERKSYDEIRQDLVWARLPRLKAMMEREMKEGRDSDDEPAGAEGAAPQGRGRQSSGSDEEERGAGPRPLRRQQQWGDAGAGPAAQPPAAAPSARGGKKSAATPVPLDEWAMEGDAAASPERLQKRDGKKDGDGSSRRTPSAGGTAGGGRRRTSSSDAAGASRR